MLLLTQVYVAGKEVMEDCVPSNHANYINLMTQYSQVEKDTKLYQIGYREGMPSGGDENKSLLCVYVWGRIIYDFFYFRYCGKCR